MINRVCYYDNDDWHAHASVGMWLEYGLVNDFMREWCLRKEQLKKMMRFPRTSILSGKSTGLLRIAVLMKKATIRKIIVTSGGENYV